VLRDFRPHIVHGAVYEGVAVAAVCGTLARIPVIIGEETGEPYGRSWKGHLLYRALMALCDHAVGVSPEVCDYFADRLRMSPRRVSLVLNGVAPQRTVEPAETAELRARLGIGDSEIVIGNVGRLFNWQKRHTDLLAAFRSLCDRRDDVRLLLVGEGPDREMLKRLAAEIGIAERVIFTGYQPDARPFYTAMDIFALPSAYEGLALVLVEAMFAHLPIVSTRVSDASSAVAGNENGFLVQPGDPPELADRLLTLVEDADLRRRFGEAGYARVQERFSARRYVEDIDQLYQRLAAENSRVARMA